MKRTFFLFIMFTAVLFLVGCIPPPTSQPTHTPIATPTTPRPSTLIPSLTATSTSTLPAPTTFISVSEILQSPDAFRDQRVQIQGYGFTTATLPLRQGYVGLDRRTLFLDGQRHQITAEVKWKPPAGARMYDPDHLRVFEGYVRIFHGEIGCPGSVKVETFPYFEVVDVK